MADALGNAGYVVTGSGGGGANGDYVFADLAELGALITEWAAIRDTIETDGLNLLLARQQIFSPADDDMSKGQAEALVESLVKARTHNKAMFDYANAYVEKLTAAREQYAADEELNVARMRGVDEG
ncbi:hypothetical protein [Actinophytocola glycyrrhizae]|uniref:PE domain-containing protein n=1 Tax=Actinophytocola glycyrrhizae TaxID=2044873 RepID=A0ABV9RZ13_9PSEU